MSKYLLSRRINFGSLIDCLDPDFTEIKEGSYVVFCRRCTAKYGVYIDSEIPKNPLVCDVYGCSNPARYFVYSISQEELCPIPFFL